MIVKWVVVIFLFGSIDCTLNEKSRDSVGVCSTITTYIQSYQETNVDTYQTVVNKPCGIFGMRTCASSRAAHRVSHRTAYRTAYRTFFYCCEGWKPLNGACEPICDPQCLADEECVSSNECEVPDISGSHVKQQYATSRLKRQDNPGYQGNNEDHSSECESCGTDNSDYYKHIEEGEEKTLLCDNSTRLKVTYTEYTLVQQSDCQHTCTSPLIVRNVYCVETNRNDVISKLCNNNQSCNISSIDSLLGKPTVNMTGFNLIAEYLCDDTTYDENCYTGRGEDYRGNVSITINNRQCQNWTSQYPHSHRRRTEKYPDAGLGPHNFCRNPSKQRVKPWCFTTDPEQRWEYCDVGSSKEDCNLPKRYNCDGGTMIGACTGNGSILSVKSFYQMEIPGYACREVPISLQSRNICSASDCTNECSDMFTSYLDIWYTCESNEDVQPPTITSTTTVTQASPMPTMLNIMLVCPANIQIFENSESIPITWSVLSIKGVDGHKHGRIRCFPESNSEFNFGITDVSCQVTDVEMRSELASCTFSVIVKGTCLPDKSMFMTNTISWPETDAGVNAESVERCSVYSNSRSFALASRQCMLNETSYGAYWAPINTIKLKHCGGYEIPSVDALSKTPTTEDNVEDVANALSDITKSSDTIDIESVQRILSNIFDVKSSSPEVTMLVIGAISDIVDANVTEGMFPANASSKIVQSIEEQVERTLRKTGKFKAITRNLAAEGVAINSTQFTNGISFGLRRGNGGLSVTEINDPSENQDEGTSSIQLPIDALFANDSDTDTQVSFVAHNDDKLFQSSSKAKTENETILGPVISAVVLGKDVNGLESQVVVKIVPSSKNLGITMNASRCVYWNFNLRAGVGDWAEDGCVLMAADSEGVTCHCNHLTNFAVLVDFSGQAEPGTLTFALDIISKIGCAFSIGALCLTLMIFILSSRLRISLQRKILIQFCISMLCLYLAFLLGIDSGTDAGCTAATFLLHYFVLTTVFWMGVEARHMYITLVSKSDRVGRKFMIKAGLFAWGAALIPVGVVLGVKWDAYQADGYCFIVPDYGLYFGLLLPVGLVVLHNVATFVFVAKKLLSSKLYVVKKDLAAGASPPDVKEIAQRMLNAFSVSMLLGITWIFGFLAIDEVRFAFQLIFCICNSFQGVMIFILFCLAQKDVRRLLGEKFRSKSSSKSRPTKKQKQLAMTPVKARKDAPVTSISDSTRVSGEIYSEDGDTVVTNLDNDTMTINTMDSSELSD